MDLGMRREGKRTKMGKMAKPMSRRAFCTAFRSWHFLHTFSQDGAHERLKVGEWCNQTYLISKTETLRVMWRLDGSGPGAKKDPVPSIQNWPTLSHKQFPDGLHCNVAKIMWNHLLEQQCSFPKRASLSDNRNNDGLWIAEFLTDSHYDIQPVIDQWEILCRQLIW